MSKYIVGTIIGTIFFFLAIYLTDYFSKKDTIYVNCSSFQNHKQAQEYFLKNNASHLDGNRNGVACQRLI